MFSPTCSIWAVNCVLDGLKYASCHEWVKHEGFVATIGITDHAQDHLGEVVFMELPEPGGSVSQGDSFGAVESVKATSDVNSPISGEVVEVNTKHTPGLVENVAPQLELIIKGDIVGYKKLDSKSSN